MGQWKKRKSKFNNTRSEYLGIKFHSIKEMNRYKFLLGLEEAGVIRDLVCQPRFPFIFPDGRKILIKGEKRNTTAKYSADFSYYVLSQDEDSRARTARFIVEDIKSPVTAKDGQFKLRIAIVKLIYDIDVKVVLKIHEPVE